jgi:mannose-1-phosphate guanylyltransferase
MVLAAGKGTRLFPLTGVIPKPLAPVADKPIIQHIFELLAGSGASEVHVNVHYLADAILGRYGEEARLGGTQTPLPPGEKAFGHGRARQARLGLRRLRRGVRRLMGDALTDVDLCELVAVHKRKGAAATLALVRVEDTSGYGVVELDVKKNILGFQEKPNPDERP